MNEIIKKTERAIIFMAWGDRYIDEVFSCIENSVLPDYDLILITDKETKVDSDKVDIVRVDFKLGGLLRKIELVNYIPEGYSSYLFLDSDTRVIEDIENGFVQAELHGMALAPAPHYSLDYFWGFDEVMKREGVKLTGQLQYNTGVIFFVLDEKTKEVFSRWNKLGIKHADVIENDQPFLSLALEKCNFNPYTLSIGYNYRGFGDAISGVVRIWHSHTDLPENINDIGMPWPPRRVIDGKVHHTKTFNNKWYLYPSAWVKDGYLMKITRLIMKFKVLVR